MARPHKGERVAILLRIPATLHAALSRLALPDRNAYIVAAIMERLDSG